MQTKHFISVKAYPAIDLVRAAGFFGLPLPEARERALIMEGEKLSEIYKYDIGQKKVHIFSFGCIVFEDMEIDETDKFFEILQPLAGEPDYRMLLRYRESHDSVVTEDGMIRLWPESDGPVFPPGIELSHTIAAVLAKSTALSKEEEDLSTLLNEASKYINRSREGIFNAGTRMYAKTMASIVRFERKAPPVSAYSTGQPLQAGNSFSGTHTIRWRNITNWMKGMDFSSKKPNSLGTSCGPVPRKGSGARKTGFLPLKHSSLRSFPFPIYWGRSLTSSASGNCCI